MTQTLTSTAEVFARVHELTGIQLSMVNTGGGNYVARARLETGEWLIATDADDFLVCDLSYRHRYELEHERPLGWYVGILPNATDDGIDGPSTEHVDDFSVTDYDATVDALPDIVARALSAYVAQR